MPLRVSISTVGERAVAKPSVTLTLLTWQPFPVQSARKGDLFHRFSEGIILFKGKFVFAPEERDVYSSLSTKKNIASWKWRCHFQEAKDFHTVTRL